VLYQEPGIATTSLREYWKPHLHKLLKECRKFTEIAFGRATPYDKTLTHIEVIGEVKE
jgi:hypothetical protein